MNLNKKILTGSLSIALLTILMAFYIKTSQSPKTLEGCCDLNAHTSFTSLADDYKFVATHENPEAFDYTGDLGKEITFQTSDGKEAHAFFIKASGTSDKYLFVIHEWWGLNDYVKKESAKFYNDLKDVNILALDLYDGKVATKREDAANYMKSTKKERAESIIQGAIGYAGKEAKIATVGWCFGGGWSLQSSILAGDQAAGCIMYYGMPEKAEAKLKKLNADVLGIFASQDKWITPEIAKEFESSMKNLDKNIEVVLYDAGHAFANPSNPKYQKKYAQDAYNKSINFLRQRL